jgi:hypothetical protein
MRLLLPRVLGECLQQPPLGLPETDLLAVPDDQMSVEIDLEIAVRTGWFGSPNDEFLLPWRSISAEQPGGLDARATGLELTQGHRCRTHHR